MKVADLMKRPVHTVTPDTGVAEAARVMGAKDVGCLPVMENGRVIGMLTDRDLRKALGEGRDLSACRCADVMAINVVFAKETESLEDAVRGMDGRAVHHLPVLGNEAALVGMLALSDLALHIMLSSRPGGPPDDGEGMGEMTPGIPTPTLADEVMRLAARDAWR